MTAMAPHVYIDDLGVCVECLLEVDLLTHGQYKRLALVSYSVSNGIWSPCRIGIAGQQVMATGMQLSRLKCGHGCISTNSI